ncbi:MAG TPA: hypothetical protein VM029_16100 [Opitutaceae bacterium]|nr:hypothetical protein [Opitutaceae bacterium]
MSRRPEIIPLLAVALGAFALGAFVFRDKTPAAPVSSRSAAPGTERKSGAAPATASVSPAAEADAHDLLASLRAKLPRSLEEVLRTLAEIGKTNPALAINLAHELGRTDRDKAAWVTNAMQQWADRDPAAAFQWLRRLTNDRMQELAGGELGSVVFGAMAARDPQMVVAHLDDLLRNGNGSESVSTPVAVHLGLAALVEHGKINLAKSVVESWAKDPLKLTLEAAAFETVATSLVKTQPRESGEWLRSLPATAERDAAFATFAASWAKHDPRGALEWAETLPAAHGQQAALRRTVSDWIEEFPDQVAGWLGDYLARVPPGAAADTLIETVINNSPTLRSAPQSALQWTNLISDPAKRVDYHATIALRWAEQDARAALEFVAQSRVIPADRKPALVQQIQLSRVAPPPGS